MPDPAAHGFGPLRNRLLTNSFSLTEFVTSDVDIGMTSDVSGYVKVRALPEIRIPEHLERYELVASSRPDNSGREPTP
jgi:hypothetical protein